MNRVLLLREKVAKIPVILSHTGARITQEGCTAFVKCDANGKPVLVNLPYLADNAPDELMDAIEGFLDHEIAHLMFTDFQLTRRSAAEGFGILHGLIEDAFVERQLAQRFPGSASNLSETGRFFLTRAVAPSLCEAVEAGDARRAMATLMGAALRAWGGQTIYQDFMQPYWPMMQAVSEVLGELVDEIVQCRSTAETYRLAHRMQQALQRVDPAWANDPAQASGDDAIAENAPGTLQRSNPGQGASASSLGQAPQFDALHVEQGTPAADGQPGDMQEAAGQPNHEAPGLEPGQAMAGFYSELDRVGGNFDQRLMELIGKYTAMALDDSDYEVYSTSNDRVGTLVVRDEAQAERSLGRLEQSVAALCGPMQKNLERIIIAQSLATWQPGRRSGRLHGANLSRLATGDVRIFRKKQEGLSRDVAVELVVDCSGSMRDCSKIQLVAQSAYALAVVLDRLNIASEVIGFTTGTDDCTDHAVGVRADTFRYSRTDSIYMPLLKGFNERMTANVKKRFAHLPHAGGFGNNVDGESLEIAARRLASRREKGKIMLVLSDGQTWAEGNKGAQRWYLKKVVEQIEQSGIKLVGLGIRSDSVTQYYTRHIVVNHLTDLPGEVLKQLKAFIVGM